MERFGEVVTDLGLEQRPFEEREILQVYIIKSHLIMQGHDRLMHKKQHRRCDAGKQDLSRFPRRKFRKVGVDVPQVGARLRC